MLKEQLELHSKWLNGNKMLKEQLELHSKWLNGEEGGVRLNLSNANLSDAYLCNSDLRYANLCNADLRNADLRNANLRNADLRNANLSDANLSGADLRYADLRYANPSNADFRWSIGNGKEIKSLQIGTYLVSYTRDILNIGCKSYTLDKWKKFTNEEISIMDDSALDWWSLNRDMVIKLVEMEIK